MARSNYVYVVIEQGIPVAAFTVKYEMERWLGRHGEGREFRVWRLRDNGSPDNGPVEIEV